MRAAARQVGHGDGSNAVNWGGGGMGSVAEMFGFRDEEFQAAQRRTSLGVVLSMPLE